MVDQKLEVTGDLAKALTRVLGQRVSPPQIVHVLAAYLDSLSRDYGLTVSAPDVSRTERAPAPQLALDVISECLGDPALLEDEVRLGDTLYGIMRELSEDGRAGKLINESKPLTPPELMQIGQIYWNLDRTESRPDLPLRSSGDFAIKVPRVNADFATMVWSSRLKNGPEGFRDNSFRTKGARLAVLMAEHLAELPTTTADTPIHAKFEYAAATGAEHRIVSITWARESHRAPTQLFTSRDRAYLAIDGFMQDFRSWVDHVRSEKSRARDDLVEAAGGRSGDQRDEPSQSAHGYFLDPVAEWSLLLDSSSALPDEVSDSLSAGSSQRDRFLPIRNRVMRGHPLQTDDLAIAESFIERFDFEHFARTHSALRQLRADHELQPLPRPGSALPERVLHNLPFADFEETGLLGREDQVVKVAAMVRQRRFPMITLTGEGGIGKTALALQACYRLVDEPDPPFEMVLWTSLKSERLTPAGIREVSNAVRDVEGATGALGRAIDQTFQGSARELAALLEGGSTLVVIDNLETAQGTEVLELFETLPESVSFLFTSRVGVGELERREPVGPLSESSAVDLFVEFARSRGLHELAAWPAEKVAAVVHQLRCSPLAIRWYILSIEAGRTPSDTLRNQGELLRFCVQNVVDALSDDERLLLAVLRALGRPVSFDELAVISEIEIDTLRSSAQRLSQGSLLVHSPASDPEETDLLTLSSTARAYLPTTPALEVTEAILQREVAYNQERERSRVGARGRYLDVNIIFERSSADAPTAHLLRRALREEKSGRSREATASVARAREINPGYFEVDRVDAVLASRRREAARATTLYRSALDSCDSIEEKAWVGYFYAGHLARRAFDIPTAITWAEQSHVAFGSFDTALQLGNLYVWDHRFAQGQELIEFALQQVPGPRFERIATTSLSECFKRWCDADLGAGSPVTALAKGVRAIEIGLNLHNTGSTDEPLMRSIVEAATAAVNAADATTDLPASTASKLIQTISSVAADRRFRVLLPWNALERAVASVAVDAHPILGPDLLAAIAEPTTEAPTHASYDKPQGVQLHGSITRIGPKYGFIAHSDFPDKVFIHGGSLRWPTKLNDLAVGTLVEFTPYLNAAGEQQARDVRPIE